MMILLNILFFYFTELALIFCLYYHLEIHDGNCCSQFTKNLTSTKALRNRVILPKIILAHVTRK